MQASVLPDLDEELDAERQGRIRVRLFGSVSVELEGSVLGPRDFGGIKPKQILELLLVARGHSVPKERLGDLLWGEDLPRNVSATLETYVSVLRRRLDPGGRRARDVLITEPGAYRIPAEAVALDLDRFDRLLSAAGACEPREARRHLEHALTLVRGEVLEDEPYATWAERLRDRYGGLHVLALLDLGELLLEEGEFAAAAAHADRAAELDASSERACRVAMVASYSMGRQEIAIRAFQRCRRVLVAEFNVEPLPETVDVFKAIRRQVEPRSLLRGVGRDRIRLDGQSSGDGLAGARGGV